MIRDGGVSSSEIHQKMCKFSKLNDASGTWVLLLQYTDNLKTKWREFICHIIADFIGLSYFS